MRPFKVTEERSKELEKVLSLIESDGQRLFDFLDSIDLPFEFSELSEKLTEEIDDKIGGVLILHIASIAMLADKPGRDMPEVVSALRDGLENSGWTNAELERFDASSDVIARLASHRTIFVGAKAASIVRQAGSHLHEIKSVVDARPIFDLNRDNIEATILITNLCITMSDASESEKQINLTLDEEDLTRIRDECDNALAKLVKLESSLEAGTIGKVVIYGRRVG